jgi:hypothetical protein
MTLKPVILPFKLVDAEDLTSNFDSAPLDIQYMDNIGVQINWDTSDGYGTFGVEVSIDKENWNSLPLSNTIQVDLVPGSAYVDLNQLSAAWLRVKYYRVSGGGTCDVWTTAKII